MDAASPWSFRSNGRYMRQHLVSFAPVRGRSGL